MRKIALHGKRGNGKYALVSEEDYDYLQQFSWSVSNTGYPCRTYRVGPRSIGRTVTVQMQRDIMKRRAGAIPSALFCDHIDRDPFNNQRGNLRLVGRSDNGFNRVTPMGISGYRGVKRMGKRWQARIGGNRNRITLGTFDTPAEAHKAYIAYVKAHDLVVPV